MGRLEDAGYGVGIRASELLFHRDRPGKREIRLINMLQVGAKMEVGNEVPLSNLVYCINLLENHVW